VSHSERLRTVSQEVLGMAIGNVSEQLLHNGEPPLDTQTGAGS